MASLFEATPVNTAMLINMAVLLAQYVYAPAPLLAARHI
jgi:hypothetical protein